MPKKEIIETLEVREGPSIDHLDIKTTTFGINCAKDDNECVFRKTAETVNREIKNGAGFLIEANRIDTITVKTIPFIKKRTGI